MSLKGAVDCGGYPSAGPEYIPSQSGGAPDFLACGFRCLEDHPQNPTLRSQLPVWSPGLAADSAAAPAAPSRPGCGYSATPPDGTELSVPRGVQLPRTVSLLACPLVGEFPKLGIDPRAGPAGAAMAPMASEAAMQKLQSRVVGMALGQCGVSL